MKEEIEKIITRISGTYEIMANDILSLFEKFLNEQEDETCHLLCEIPDMNKIPSYQIFGLIIQSIKNKLRSEVGK